MGKELITAIRKFPLRERERSYQVIFKLAQDILGVEKRLKVRVSTTITALIIEHWKSRNKQFLTPGHDYHAELIGKLSVVRKPGGAVLADALARARNSAPIPQTLLLSEEFQLLAKLCRELQCRAGGSRPFYPDGRGARLGVPNDAHPCGIVSRTIPLLHGGVDIRTSFVTDQSK